MNAAGPSPDLTPEYLSTPRPVSPGTAATLEAVADALSPNNAALFAYLPVTIRKQLLAERDPHGNVQVSVIETEKLLAEVRDAQGSPYLASA